MPTTIRSKWNKPISHRYKRVAKQSCCVPRQV